MTEPESVVYRVVPKCACSTIGQIMYYSDHGEFLMVIFTSRKPGCINGLRKILEQQSHRM